MSKHYALVDKSTNLVVNIVVADDPSIFTDVTAVELAVRPEIGWLYDGSSFAPTTPPVIVRPTLTEAEAAALIVLLNHSNLSPDRIAAIEAKLVPDAGQ